MQCVTMPVLDKLQRNPGPCCAYSVKGRMISPKTY